MRADQQKGKLNTARLLIAGRGIGSPNAGPGGAAYAGIAYEVTTQGESRDAVRELAARKVDSIKIWVDDRNGRAPKLPAPLYRVIIDEAHVRGIPVIAHVFYHDDAVDLVDAGIDGFAHLVRDKVMDDGLIAMMVKRGTYVMGNLSFPRRSTYASVPPWLAAGDPMAKLLSESVSAPVLARMRAYFAKRDAKSVEGARERYKILEQSIAKLSQAGAKLILGADTGLEDHLFGMAEQLELQAMVDAGMTPAQGIVAATSRSAEFLRLPSKGSLKRGLDADFLVLDANPLDDITNTRRISRMVINGSEIDRAQLAALRFADSGERPQSRWATTTPRTAVVTAKARQREHAVVRDDGESERGERGPAPGGTERHEIHRRQRESDDQARSRDRAPSRSRR